jgi:hypothetical protein
MPVLLTVLANDQGEVVGTAATQIPGQGTGLPGRVSLVPRADQQVIEIEVGEEVLNLDPPELHEFIKTNYLRPAAESVASAGPSGPENDRGGGSRKAPGSPGKDRDAVITPAGPRPKDRVRAVRPNEAVRRNPDATYTVVPEDNGAKKAGRTDPGTNRRKNKRQS